MSKPSRLPQLKKVIEAIGQSDVLDGVTLVFSGTKAALSEMENTLAQHLLPNQPVSLKMQKAGRQWELHVSKEIGREEWKTVQGRGRSQEVAGLLPSSLLEALEKPRERQILEERFLSEITRHAPIDYGASITAELSDPPNVEQNSGGVKIVINNPDREVASLLMSQLDDKIIGTLGTQQFNYSAPLSFDAPLTMKIFSQKTESPHAAQQTAREMAAQISQLLGRGLGKGR